MRELSILECEYWPNHSYSVLPFFNALSINTSSGGKNFEFDYERFVGSKSFIETLKFLIIKKPKYIYIAGHGSNRYLQAPDKTRIKIQDICDIVKCANGVRGIYFASCYFANEENAELIINSAKCDWVAGYQKSATWIESACLDMLFWEPILTCDSERKQEDISKIAKKLSRQQFYAASVLGFNVFTKTPNRNRIKNLIHQPVKASGLAR